MKKAKKILLIVLAAALFLATAAYFYFVRLRWGWRPLPGWPSFLLDALCTLCPMVGAWLILKVIWPKVRPEEKITWKTFVLALAAVAWMLGLSAGQYFSADKKASEFFNSPNRKNSVVVFTDYSSSTFCPAKWRLLYKQDYATWNFVGIYSDEDVTYTYSWLDDDTLEFVITKENGTSETKYIRW